MKLTHAAIVLSALWALSPCATPLLAQEKLSPQLRREIQKIVRAEVQRALAGARRSPRATRAPKVVFEAPRVPGVPLARKVAKAPKAPKAAKFLKVTKSSTVYGRAKSQKKSAKKTAPRKATVLGLLKSGKTPKPQVFQYKKTELPRTYVVQGSKVLSGAKGGLYQITGRLDDSVRKARTSIGQAMKTIKAAKGLSSKQRAAALKGLTQACKALGGIQNFKASAQPQKKKGKKGVPGTRGLRILKSQDGHTLQIKGLEMPGVKHQVQILMDKEIKGLEPRIFELLDGKLQLKAGKLQDVEIHILTPHSKSKSKKAPALLKKYMMEKKAKKKAPKPKKKKRRIVI